MRRGCMMLAIALAACAPPPPPKATAVPIEAPRILAGCTGLSSRDWSAVGSQYYVIEAEAAGESCADATATLRIESRDGAVLYERSYAISEVPLAFNPHNDQTGMRVDLDGWTQNTAETATADTLPAWPARDSQPPNFTPAVTRGAYEAARGAQGPLFCYPDGAASNACIALAGNQATLLGSLNAVGE
jgi:hypothetical protein